MYITDVKEEFFNVINDSRVLLMVNFDVDGICASKILQSLFSCESITYTLVPVEGLEDVKTTFSEHCDEIKYVVFINCAGTHDIVEVLQPEEHHVFFIIDSHRPTDLCNVYSSSQVRVIGKGDEEDIPDFEDVFKESEDEDDEDEGVSGDESDPEESHAAKRRRMTEEGILKRRERRLWEEKRDRLVFEYSQFSYYSHSSALVVFQIATALSKDSVDMLWWAILGVTEQLLLQKVEFRQYVFETGVLQKFVSSVNADTAENKEAQNISAPRITYIKDFNLALFRHWSAESSVRHSMYTACKLQLWTIRGERKLQELFVQMGLPLAEAKKKFSSMSLELRKEFPGALEKAAQNYEMDQLTFPSFLLQFGYRNKYSAADQVYALISLLESGGSRKECFLQTLDALSRMHKKIMEQGIEKAKQMMMGIFKTVQASLEMKNIFTAGPFMYLVIQEGAAFTRMFCHPHSLVLLAHFILRAYTSSRKTKDISKPLLVSAPQSSDPFAPKCIIVGVPPVLEDSPRNFFGKAFEQAAERTGSRVELDYFDASIIRLHTEDRAKFFDALAALLK